MNILLRMEAIETPANNDEKNNIVIKKANEIKETFLKAFANSSLQSNRKAEEFYSHIKIVLF